ncbi:hypothetical protein PTTG_03824 [Puccinia triticina 1-1 BBBD Race 1]|uniref:DUF4218 domain-containing protein n=1 Tax=Puccinia triticina (isolate 1-1 / race 1 (BBBD)) TaxID=630390 RepID=A0A180FZ93_PUCT1|nr:hypothetical protein PTTG_03824 [Puccinia triticina 1-1 BBBD Race 1]
MHVFVWLLHLTYPLCTIKPPPPRVWEDTISKMHKFWTESKTEAKTEYDNKTKENGLKDNINVEFVERYHQRNKPGQRESIEATEKTGPHCLFNRFDGCKDTPVEILHVLQLGVIRYLLRDFMEGLTEGDKRRLEAHWQSFNRDSLNIPSLRSIFMVNHYKSFIGKHMKIVIQAAPFVFFPFMNRKKRDLWMSLCYLCTFVYQTRIENMDRYIEDLKHHIDLFLYHVLSMNAQWVNKPKFHMLIHLPESVRRFGPPCLFASEKFEAYNGIMRNASIHSNRQAPGRDIALTFSNYQAMRLILSGVILFNHKLNAFFRPSKNVTDVFKHNKEVQKLMGIDLSQPIAYPVIYDGEYSAEEGVAPPIYLVQQYPTVRWRLISSIKTGEYDIVRKGIFVLVSWQILL